MRYELVIFDLDGTLVDSIADIAGALNAVIGARGMVPLPLHTVRTLVGDGVIVLATRALALRDPDGRHDAQEIARAIQAHYLDNVCQESRLYPAITEVLQALRCEPERRLAVLTNKPGNVARPLLETLGIASSFDAIIGDFDGFPRKPAPDAARALADRFDVALGRTLMVGDGLPDLAIAAAAPCDSAACLWGYTDPHTLMAQGPTHVLRKPGDLLVVA